MKKQQMKLESLSGSKFEVLSNETMRFIVGGAGNETGSTSGKTGLCYSNDFTDAGRVWAKPGGGDFDSATLKSLVASSSPDPK